MKVYTFKATGLALGSVIVIVGVKEGNARKAAAKWCSENNIDPTTLTLESSKPFTGGAQIVYAWNGDY